MKPETEKLCTHCRRRKPNTTEFFHCKTAPYCKACNTEAGRLHKYKREAQADPRAFAIKLRLKETQLDAMVKALSAASNLKQTT